MHLLGGGNKAVKKKLIAYAATAFLVSLSLQGCGKGPSKKDLQSELSVLRSNNEASKTEIESLKRLLATYNPSLAEVQDLSDHFTLATGEEAYLSIRDRINILNPLEVKPRNIIQNQTIINLNNDVTFIPSNNWTVQLSSGSMEMNHENGVYGQVETYEYIGDESPATFYKAWVHDHLEAIHAEEFGGQKRLFLSNGTLAGVESLSRIKVAHLSTGNAIKTEDMTKSYEELNQSDSEVTAESTEATLESTETTLESTEATLENTETTLESTDTQGDNKESTVETTEDTGIFTGETVDNGSKNIDNYIYTCAVASYSKDDTSKSIIVFKFFYKENDPADMKSKQEFVENTIKSFALSGNYLNFQ